MKLKSDKNTKEIKKRLRELTDLIETEIKRKLLSRLNRWESLLNLISFNQRHNFASNDILISRRDGQNCVNLKINKVQMIRYARIWKQNEIMNENAPWFATLTTCVNSDRWMCLLSEVNRSSIGGGGSNGDGAPFGFGAMDFVQWRNSDFFFFFTRLPRWWVENFDGFDGLSCSLVFFVFLLLAQ